MPEWLSENGALNQVKKRGFMGILSAVNVHEKESQAKTPAERVKKPEGLHGVICE